jgi:hypothetical protein
MLLVVFHSSLLYHSNHDPTFFQGVYDFGPKRLRRSFFDILCNPVPETEFEEVLDEADNLEAL